MKSKKIQEGFQSQKLLVLPGYILEEMSRHPLVKSLYLTDIGYFPQAQHHYRERTSGCSSHILIYNAAGEGWVECLGQPVQVIQPHTLTLIPEGTPHRYGADEADPWSIYWFHFKGEEAQEFIAGFRFLPGSLKLAAHDSLKLLDLFHQCYESLAEKPYSLPHHIFVSQSIRYLLGLIGLGVQHPQEDRKEAYVEASIRYMAEHLNTTLKLPQLAEHVNLSKPHLIHLFKQTTGFSPVDYFLRMKMRRAAELLDLTGVSVKEISGMIGIQDPYYFSRIFKKIMGTSPTDYRNTPKG